MKKQINFPETNKKNTINFIKKARFPKVMIIKKYFNKNKN